jgi:cell wall-associated NlpC family hydrolase
VNPRSAAAVAAGGVGVFALGVTALAFAMLAALGGPLAGGGCGGDGGIGGGSQQIGPRSWSAEQTANARTIIAAAITKGLPRRAAVLAVATAIVESGLRNINHGDRDSLGLFQQRPSKGWGTVEDILNPAYATAQFYAHLLAVPGWQTMPASQAEQAVQRSGNPGAYAVQEPAAADLVAKFWSGPDNPAPPPSGANPATPQQPVMAVFGCPDQGGSNLPLGPSTLDERNLPLGFTLPVDPTQRAAVSYALAQRGMPYVWGAEGPGSFDCSGLMQAAYAAAGIPISRSTATQVHDGTPVPGLEQLTPGDLLLIPGADGTPAHPGHVGMYAGNGVIVDAYDTSKGVILEKLTDWQNKIVAIRHITGPATGPVSTSSPSMSDLAGSAP